MSLHILDNSWSNVFGGSDSSNHLPHTDGPEDDTVDHTFVCLTFSCPIRLQGDALFCDAANGLYHIA